MPRLRDIDSLVHHLKLGRLALFGANQGGPAAIAYTARHPERVTRLIIVNSYARGRDWRARPVHSAYRSLFEALGEEEWETFTLAHTNLNLDFTDAGLARRLAARYRESMTPETLRAFYESEAEIDVTELMPRVAAPTLVVQRRVEPRGYPIEWTREIASGDSGRAVGHSASPAGTRMGRPRVCHD